MGRANWGKGSPIVKYKDCLLKQLNCLICLWVVDSGGPKEAQVQSYSSGGSNVHNFNRICQVAPMCPDGRAHLAPPSKYD